MVKRQEEDIVAQAPILVVLGGKEYKIAPQVIRDSRGWRAKVIDLIAPLPGLLETSSDKPDDFGAVLRQMMVTMPDQVLDLFFEYAKDLNREEIEGMATDAEIAEAFEKVVAVAFPLAKSLLGVMKHLSQ